MSVVYSDFGPHLMLDCRDCNTEKISNLAYVFDFLDQLPDMIGMTKITQPHVFPYSGLVPEDCGITGAVIIAESHLTFHSFVEKDYFFFDMFSCKEFDIDLVVNTVVEAFDVKDFEKHLAARGRFFPRSVTPKPASVPMHLNVQPVIHDVRIPAGAHA